MSDISNIELIGAVVPGTIRENGRNTLSFNLSVKRKSGTEDVIIIIASLDYWDEIHKLGDIRITGVMRSFHWIFVMAEVIERADGKEHMNQCRITGCVCKPTSLRITQRDRHVSSTTLASYINQVETCFAPVVFWGRNAERSLKYKGGDKLSLKGRLQSRTYIKNGEQQVTYEISVSSVKEK